MTRTFLIVLSLASCGAVHATTIAGRVVSVADGDTLTILDADKQRHVIRLDGIDAPEKGQAFGQASKRHLSALAFDREAEAECHKVDRYGRRVCSVVVAGVDVCLEVQEQSHDGW
jgi:endonuclease YncB( thermonuclease family)